MKGVIPMGIFNALIRTHHISSRKKVASLSQAAKKHRIYALLHVGAPGVMYVEGDHGGVTSWVGEVKRLRYLDYHLLRRPAEASLENLRDTEDLKTAGLHEVDAIKDFGAEMERRGVLQWWRKAMEFDPPDHRL